MSSISKSYLEAREEGGNHVDGCAGDADGTLYGERESATQTRGVARQALAVSETPT